jgi:hypothetical protein
MRLIKPSAVTTSNNVFSYAIPLPAAPQKQPGRVVETPIYRRQTGLLCWARDGSNLTTAAIIHRRRIVLSKVDEDGFISVSRRGGDEGFVQVVDDTAIRFDDLPGTTSWKRARTSLPTGARACSASFRKGGD